MDDEKKPKIPNSRKMEDLHAEFMRLHDAAEEAVSADREKANEIVRFIHKRGAQWSDWARKVRGKRPMPEINATVKKLEVVKGDQRQSRVSSKIRATGGGGREKIAQAFEGHIRAITSNNETKAARNNAFEEAVDCGIGAYYGNTRYESDDSFSVEPCLKIIRNARSCVFWTNDGTDALHRDTSGCFVDTMMTREEVERRWPDSKAANKGLVGKNGPHKGWSSSRELRVSDFWRKEPHERTIGQFRDAEGNGFVYEIDPKTMQIMDEMAADGLELVMQPDGKPRVKTSKSHKVVHYVLSGSEILEGPHETGSSYIPVFMVYGFSYCDEEGIHHYGLAEHMQDAQRKLNYECGAIMEASAKAANDPIVSTKEMISDNPAAWMRSNVETPAVLTFKPDPNRPGDMPKRLGPPSFQSGLNLQLQQSTEFLKVTSGIWDQSVGSSDGNESGRAILAQQAKGETGTFVLKDNLASAINYETEWLIDLLPSILDAETQLRVLREDGKTEEIQLVNREITDEETGKVIRLKDFRLPKYDVVTDIGPSYATQRIENLNALTALAGQIPALGQVGADVIVGELDITKADELRDRFEIMNFMQGVSTPGPERAKELVEKIMTNRQALQSLQPQQQEDPMQAMAMKMQIENMKSELMEGGAKIDETVANRVAKLVDSLEKINLMPLSSALEAAREGIFHEIQQALTSNDGPQGGQTALPEGQSMPQEMAGAV